MNGKYITTDPLHIHGGEETNLLKMVKRDCPKEAMLLRWSEVRGFNRLVPPIDINN